MGAREHFVDRFVARRPDLPGAALAWLTELREAALARFAAQGFPTVREEAWKYTNVAAIERRAFEPGGEGDEKLAAALAARLAFDGCDVLVFVDGRWSAALSRVGALPAGATVASLAHELQARPQALRERLTAAAAAGDNAFANLNGAFWADGACIDLAREVALERPIHLLFVATRHEGASFPRNLVRLAEGAQATVVEHHVGAAGVSHLTDAVTRIDLHPGASLVHAKLQEEEPGTFHVAQVVAEQAAGSRFASQSFALGALIARTDIATRLAGERAETELVGLYLGEGRRHIDHHTSIEHEAVGCTSRELYKGILDGASRAVFDGRVVVRPGAQKSDAEQANRNLLLSAAAEVDTKPQLEIYADDVKCRHGATVGQLDPAQLFYLQSRGVGIDSARSLLVQAFAREMVERASPAPLRRRLEALLSERLPGSDDRDCGGGELLHSPFEAAADSRA